jgi:hypothetical protein
MAEIAVMRARGQHEIVIRDGHALAIHVLREHAIWPAASTEVVT